MDLTKVGQIIAKHVDEKALALDLVAELVYPALKDFAAKTENKVDDVAVELLIAAIDKALA